MEGETSFQRPVSQLLMRMELRDGILAAQPLPAGYELRRLSAGEDAALLEVLREAFPEAGWTADTLRVRLTEAPDVEAIYVVVFEGRPVATSSVRYLPDRFPDEGILHWVAVASAHRGRRLGRHVAQRVCRHFREDGYEAAVLETDDFRLPAIKTYLSLGFKPLICESGHRGRWEAVMQKLNVRWERTE